VSEHVSFDVSARLTFEVSDGVTPMQLHCTGTPHRSGNVLAVALAPRVASRVIAGLRRRRELTHPLLEALCAVPSLRNEWRAVWPSTLTDENVSTRAASKRPQ